MSAFSWEKLADLAYDLCNVEKYYHYTDSEGIQGIRRDKRIDSSTKENRATDARLGDGVYVTDLDPWQDDYKLAKNNWNLGADRYIEGGGLDYAVEIEINPKLLTKGYDGRRIFRYPDDIELTDFTYKIYHRHNGTVTEYSPPRGNAWQSSPASQSRREVSASSSARGSLGESESSTSWGKVAALGVLGAAVIGGGLYALFHNDEEDDKKDKK